MSQEKILLIKGLIVGTVLVGYKAGVFIGVKNFLNKAKKQSDEKEKK